MIDLVERRACLAARLPALLLAAVVAIGAGGKAFADETAGPWRVVGNFYGIAFTLDCNFKLDSARLGGVCVDATKNGVKSEVGKSHVLTAGSVNGDKVSWTYPAHYLLNRFDVTFSGVRTGNRMTGAIDLKGHGGTFTAIRP